MIRKPRLLPQSFGEEIWRDAPFFLGLVVFLVGWHVVNGGQAVLGIALMAAGFALMI